MQYSWKYVRAIRFKINTENVIIITTTTTTTIIIIIIIIIIITNEKIKVMLSRKRCRGTLQDYYKGEISKCQSKLWTNRNVWMERGRKQFEEMVVDCSMHAVQRRGKHDHPG